MLVIVTIPQTTISASGWGFIRNEEHEVPNVGKYKTIIDQTNSFYVGDSSKKDIYLTFDAGYDNGNLPLILDTLAKHETKATFFVTGDFINRFPDLIIRMVYEGHLVANHSYYHRPINEISKNELTLDLKKLEDKYLHLVQKEMVKIFRPPEGKFDLETIRFLNQKGYKVVFWSIAYFDWDVNNQKGALDSYNNVINNIHNGAIILMHSVSTSNQEALPKIIEKLKNDNYQFKLVTELEKKIS